MYSFVNVCRWLMRHVPGVYMIGALVRWCILDGRRMHMCRRGSTVSEQESEVKRQEL